MNLKIGMPEILVLFSLFMYGQSFTFAVIAFCLGMSGRICAYLMDYSTEMKKAEVLNQSADEIGSALKGIFGANE